MSEQGQQEIPPEWQHWFMNFLEIVKRSNQIVNRFDNEEFNFTSICKDFIDNNKLIEGLIQIIEPSTPYYYWITNLTDTHKEAEKAIIRYYEFGVEDRARDICLQILDLGLELEKIEEENM